MHNIDYTFKPGEKVYTFNEGCVTEHKVLAVNIHLSDKGVSKKYEIQNVLSQFINVIYEDDTAELYKSRELCALEGLRIRLPKVQKEVEQIKKRIAELEHAVQKEESK